MHSNIRSLTIGVLLAAVCSGSMSACGSSELTTHEQDSAADASGTPTTQPPQERRNDAALGLQPGSPRGDAGLASSPSSVAPAAAGCQTFDSSFAAIQALIFERHGCTAAACHGQAKSGGLDLSADVAWENLVDAKSSNSAAARVQPGTAVDSFLYQKLAAATNPGSLQVAGTPMPIGSTPLTDDELQAVQLWIVKGAPKDGIVADKTKGIDVGSLLDACLPPATPTEAKPLDAPAADEGIQFRLPVYKLKAGTEVEQCIPFAFDFTDKVPAKFKDVSRNVMFTNGSRVRQDAQSHHMVVWNPAKDLTSVSATDPGWLCHGGANDGKLCNAQKGSADCGDDGVCAGPATPGTLCNVDTTALAAGGPPTLDSLAGLFGIISGGLPQQVANTQGAQQYIPPFDGVYEEIPLRGILWFNTHAFNLTEEDTTMHARLNYYYAQQLTQEMRPVNVIDHNGIADGQAPFTRKTYCEKAVVPQHYSIAMLTGHTHRRGEHFWVTDATSTKIYESFVYSDPAYTRFDPWLTFDQPDEASRTLEYCATYNNGLTKDDKPDLELVTRLSTMPKQTSCVPVACVAGKVTAACMTDRDCDSAPGANDGDCDACPIKAGGTTENEMFVLMPWYVLPPKQ
ncbi:MAG: hypothetical protein JWN04_2097 [Myxococcaceae bacterium]|nr:hypothetical protein [Myxococcaceae bacterium]